MNVQITEKSKKLFIAYAEDADNWSGTPLVGGNVSGSKEDRGNLTQLKVAGLIKTFNAMNCMWIEFTAKGKEYAKSLGIEL